MRVRTSALFLLAALAACAAHAASPSQSDVDWTRLPELIKQCPPPPISVADTQRYRRDIAPRLDAMEQALENYERHLERMSERLNAMSERDVRQSFSETELQGKAATERLARQSQADTPQARARDRREETSMRETLPGGSMPRVSAGQLNQAVLAFAMQSANLQRREETETQRLTAQWQAADARCDDDERCAKTEESRHLGKMAQAKNAILTGLKSPWGFLKSASVDFSGKSKAAIESVRDAGGWLDRTTIDAAKETMKFIVQLEAVRVLLGSFGLLVNSSRQHWDEASTIREQMENIAPQAARGTAENR